MVRRVVAVSMAMGLVMALGVTPSGAGTTTTISIVEFRFIKAKASVPLGGSVRWTNDGTQPHTATQDARLRFFDTGQLVDGATSMPATTMWAAGRFAYHCRNHPMYGLVKVPVEASSSRIGLGEAVTITVSSDMAFKGYTFDLQRKRNRGRWVMAERSIGSASVELTPKRTGRFRFRARVVDLDGNRSGWSPAARVLVGDV
jgi:plastocyanin